MLRPGLPGLLCLGILLLSGCVSTSEDSPALGTVAASQATDPSDMQTPENPDPEPVSSAMALADPDDLLGLEPREIQAMLGPVSLKRWEGDGQVMQFKGGQCVMDIYFYENTPGGAFQVTYLSARNNGGADIDTAACLTSLLPN